MNGTLKEPFPPDTQRMKIIDHLIARFEGCIQGQNGRFMTWNTVSDCPITDAQKQLGNTIGIFDGRENKKPEVGSSRATLSLMTEFHVRLAKGDKPNRIANLVLGEVQSIMLSDIYAGGLCLNIVEVGNELDVEGPQDTAVSGIIFWEVQYRHKAGNPRQQV